MKKKIIPKILISLLITISIIGLVFTIYVNDYYHADMDSINKFTVENNAKMILKDDAIIYEVENATTGIIFYPGGKVEYTSYLPLMKSLASKGILTILIKMPFNLAVMDINAAEDYQTKYKNIDNWYMSGHSLGGSMAGNYISDNLDKYDGLILLASYVTDDLSKSKIKVLSIYGSEDKILNMKNYKKNKVNFPNNYKEIIIEGGNHSYFGMYGLQDKDGKPSITNEEQIMLTSNAIFEFLK